jgi:hypothetical protein
MSEVWEDEVAATEAWLGVPFPGALKALWAERGPGVVEGSGDVVLGPFDVVDMVDAAQAWRRGPGALPFLRAADGAVFAVDASGAASGPGALPGEDAHALVARRAAVPPVAVAEGGVRRVLRSLAGALAPRQAQA